MHVWPTEAMTGPRFVINFPTKGHWRARSRLRDIEAGLHDLARVVVELNIHSLAVPPLGCGNGGLEWGEVEPRIVPCSVSWTPTFRSCCTRPVRPRLPARCGPPVGRRR